MKLVVIGVLALLISACASNPPAPVVDRTAPVVDGASRATKSKAVVNAVSKPNNSNNSNDWRPDYHVVKKGDTLISLGLQYGYYYKDIAAANNIPTPFIIKIGQIINLSHISAQANTGETNNPSINQAEEGVVLTPLGSNSAPDNGVVTLGEKLSEKPGENKLINKNKPVIATPALIPTLSEPKAMREPYSLTAMNRVEPVQSNQNSKNTKDATGKPLEPKVVEAKPATSTAIDSKNIPAKSAESKPGEPIAIAPDVAKDVTTGEVLVEPKPTSNDVKSTDTQTVQWVWPVRGKVIASFNEASNKGLDIGGITGQAINAASGGKVIYSGSDLRGYGKLVIIKHNKTFLSVYAHNSKIIVKEGQIVASGQKIAEMGDTDSNTVKLHFEIRRLGKSVNPAQYLN